MSSLAGHLLKIGHAVSGSDRQPDAQTEKLQKLGATVFLKHSAQNVQGSQLVVRSSAVPLSNCEVVYAQQHGIPVVLREELLGYVFDGFSTRIAVCGTHGKTTVTAWIHHLLERCGVEHAAFIGGEYKGENYFFGKNTVVAEACEYNRSFLNLHPTLCVCLNVEHDHPDCYATEEQTEQAFCKLFEQSEQVILPFKQKGLRNGASVFGGEEICAENVRLKNGKPFFQLFVKGDFVADVQLSVFGEHNVDNALAVFAVAVRLGLPLLQAAKAVSTFCGVERRWTKMPCKVPVVCDYAHHPTEIKTTVRTAKSVCNGKVVCVFQPHTYSRTKAFQKEFVSCFDGADEVIYLPIFPAREQPIKNVSSFQLYKRAKAAGKNALYFSSFQAAAKHLLCVGQNDLIVLVGAGDVNKLALLLN